MNTPINDTWLSGKPFYCTYCGAGYGEYMACEDVHCQLETEKAAQTRLLNARAEQAA